MSEMKDFDVLMAPLSGVHLVEANAGTGKTWNIEALVIRLLIEKRLEPGAVLVVTFTDAAAQELRERILERINQVYEALNTPEYSGADVFLQACKVKYGSNESVLDHLETCKSRFDEASIYTIHSFCKQVLTDFRFEAGLETEMQILPDSRVIQQEVIKDEWRTLNHRFSRGPESRLADILNGKVSLSQLETSFSIYSSKSGVKLDTNPESILNQANPSVHERWSNLDPLKWIQDYVQILEQAIQIWDEQQDEIRRQWLDTEISRYDYAKDGDKWESALVQFLEKPISGSVNSHVEKFTSTFVQNKPLKKSSTAPRPDHRFFELIDFLFHSKKILENYILRESCERMKRSYLQKRVQQQVLIFDDLLEFTEKALDPEKNGENAYVLVNKLREKYPVALIDEFQDTDQIQYSIFRRVYVNNPGKEQLLYMIGDPKQSIYLFRGADLKTYFKARRDAKITFTLSRNFRSNQALIKGVNAVFEGKYSFLDAELSYKPSTTHKTESILDIKHESTAPVRFIDVVSRSDTKAPKEMAVMKWVVSSISRLLSSKNSSSIIKDKSTGQPRPVHPGDIAILVATHNQSRRIKHLLAEVGIPAVESGDASVFLSEEATYLNLLLDVVLDPRRIRKVRALLTTPLFGLTKEQVDAFENDVTRWSELSETFRTGEQISTQKGILAGLKYLFVQLDIEKNLVKQGNGERSLTNLRHLSELLHSEEEKQRRSLSGLASWLLVQRNDADAIKSDERSMRLESDDERVHIITMHRSKGLQFPIVYAPFLWAKAWGQKTEVFYNGNKLSGELERTYDPDNLVHADGSQCAKIESLQDRIRLLYVTLTRAEERCYIPFSSGKDFQLSPLHAALAARIAQNGLDSEELGKAVVESDNSKFVIPEEWDNSNLIRSLLTDLGKKHPQSVHFELCDFIEKPVFFEQKTYKNTIKAREFDQNEVKRLYPGRILSSYSSIQRKYGHESTFDLIQRDEHAGQNHDAASGPESSRLETNLPRDRKAIFDFPKGANTGNYWHEILETIDFADASNWEAAIDQLSTKYGFTNQSDRETVLKLIQNTVESPIGQHPKFMELNQGMSDLKLSGLQWTQTLREMEFLYPYSPKELEALIGELRKSSESKETISALTNIMDVVATNLLTGLIDLVFESKGKFFILDYKSNYLGDSLHSYSSNEVEKDIRLNGYNLQYHLYTAALVKYLSKQIQEFSYDSHFGGVFYLYWRGLNPEDITGVFFDKPEWKDVEPIISKLIEANTISGQSNIKQIEPIVSTGGLL